MSTTNIQTPELITSIQPSQIISFAPEISAIAEVLPNLKNSFDVLKNEQFSVEIGVYSPIICE